MVSLAGTYLRRPSAWSSIQGRLRLLPYTALVAFTFSLALFGPVLGLGSLNYVGSESATMGIIFGTTYTSIL
jgi:hypothetical protein